MNLLSLDKTIRLGAGAIRLTIVTAIILCWSLPKAHSHTTTLDSDTLALGTKIEEVYKKWHSSPDSLQIISLQFLKESRILGYREGAVMAFRNIGAALYEKGQYAESIHEYTNGISLANRYGLTTLHYNLLSNRAMAFTALGMYNLSLRDLNAALTICQNARENCGHIYNNLGMLYHYQDEMDKALAYYLQAKSAYQTPEIPERLAFILSNIGLVYLDKDPEKARESFTQALEASVKTGNEKAVATALLSLGNLSLQEGDISGALTKITEAERKFRKIGEKVQLTKTLLILAGCEENEGQLKAAIDHTTEALELAKVQQDYFHIDLAAQQLSGYMRKTGKMEQAFEYLELSRVASDSLSAKSNRADLVRQEERFKYKAEQQKISADYDKKIHQKELTAWILGFLALVVIMLAVQVYWVYRRQKKHNRMLQKVKQVIERKNDELQAQTNLREEMIALVAHDVRSPILSLREALRNLEMQQIEKEKFSSLMLATSRNLENLSVFLDNLILWVHSHSETLKTEIKPVDLAALVEKQISIYAVKTEQVQVTVINTIEKECLVLADKTALEIIVRNLLDNAIKCCPGGTVYIDLHTTPETGSVTLNITDSGTNIPQALVDWINMKDATEVPAGITLGLGLWLCRRYAEIIGTKISVETNSSQGARFYIPLPLA